MTNMVNNVLEEIIITNSLTNTEFWEIVKEIVSNLVKRKAVETVFETLHNRTAKVVSWEAVGHLTHSDMKNIKEEQLLSSPRCIPTTLDSSIEDLSKLQHLDYQKSMETIS